MILPTVNGFPSQSRVACGRPRPNAWALRIGRPSARRGALLVLRREGSGVHVDLEVWGWRS
jgi:hypothetical protein